MGTEMRTNMERNRRTLKADTEGRHEEDTAIFVHEYALTADLGPPHSNTWGWACLLLCWVLTA